MRHKRVFTCLSIPFLFISIFVWSVLPISCEQKQIVLTHDELVQYMLDLVNDDRVVNNVSPVTLGENAAAQDHAEDMLVNYYLSHWDSDGMKPYMRYTMAGGVNYEVENSAYHGWYDSAEDPNRYEIIDVKQVLRELQYNMVYDDADSNWGHRDAMLNKLHKKVNIGIAYDEHRLALVQQFEGDYVEFKNEPVLSGEVLSLSGSISLGRLTSVLVYYDPIPSPLISQQLNSTERSYDTGKVTGYILPPQYHVDSGHFVNANNWEVTSAGSFDIEANIHDLLFYGNGVYTFHIISQVDTELVNLTNYSIVLPATFAFD